MFKFKKKDINYYCLEIPEFSELEIQLIKAIVKAIERQDYSFEIEHSITREFLSNTFPSFLIDHKLEHPDILVDRNTLKKIVSLFEHYLSKIPIVKNAKILAQYIVYNLYNLPKINYLLEDDNIEEIEVNGPNIPVYVYHRDYGHCETNIIFNYKQINELVRRIESFSGKKGDKIETYLPGGDRVHITKKSITPFGPSITIRKFRRIKFTIFDLIKSNCLDVDVAAFLWLLVEGLGYPMNILIAGNTGAGKTTTLNVLLQFCPINERIITIEDTLELDLSGRKNVVRLVSTPEVSLKDLLISSLRMRPDRIIIGEVRGEEAKTLFTAMNVGHRGVMGTIHANNSKDTILRLTSYPMNVPEDMISTLNYIITQHRIIKGGKEIRRIVEISEIEQIDKKPKLSPIYIYDPKEDKLVKTDITPRVYQWIAENTGKTIKEVLEEHKKRAIFLENLMKEKEFTSEELPLIFTKYINEG
jgi:flagellar protein FlaI